MADATFDGPNRIIVLESGPGPITTVVGKDLYSAWKRFSQLTDNLKFAPAFRVIAGDTLPGSLIAAPYFFLQNQTQTDAEGGWRIRPAEEDITYLFTGNLVPEDSTQDMGVPSVGGFTALVLGIQPVTQGTTQLQDDLTEIKNNIATRKDIDFTGADSLGWQEVLYDEDDVEVGRFNLFDETDSRITLTAAAFIAAGKMIKERVPV